MSLVTAGSIRAAYSFLQHTAFVCVAMRPVGRMKFEARALRNYHGWYIFDTHTLQVSTAITSAQMLLQVVAHEMLHQHLNGADHGEEFTRVAARICKLMRWKKGSV